MRITRTLLRASFHKALWQTVQIIRMRTTTVRNFTLPSKGFLNSIFELNFPEGQIQWEIDLFPRGVRYNKAQLINVFYVQGNNNSLSAEIPETVLKIIRLRVTCKANLEEEKKFKVRNLMGSKNFPQKLNFTFFP